MSSNREEISLHREIISKIHETVPEERDRIKFLSSILGISNKSAYRRITGTTQFSIEEAATLVSHLGFSLDALIGHLPKQNALFELQNIEDYDFDICYRKMEQYIQIFRNLEGENATEYMLATNSLPIGICVKYTNLYKFTLYKWLYWTNRVEPSFSFSQFELTDELVDIQKQYDRVYSGCQKGTLIIDDFFYHSVATEINFFSARGLLSEDERGVLLHDLFDSIKDLEHAATNGYYEDQVKLDLYISGLKIDTTYLHVIMEERPTAYFSGYSINLFRSNDIDICEIQKNWLKSLMRYSSSITQTNELYRFSFFDKQREVLKEHLDK